MSTKFCARSILFFIFIGIAAGVESYMDYGDEVPEKSPAENIDELYRLLLQRNILENAGYSGIPLEHLMIRKSQRSPSLRLRFGRSDPHLYMGLQPRHVNPASSSGFEDNN